MPRQDGEQVRKAVIHDTQFVPSWSAGVDAALVRLLRQHHLEQIPSILIAESRTGYLPSRLIDWLPASSRLMLVDPSKEMLNIARKRMARADQRIFYSAQPLNKMSYADGVFELVLCDSGLLTHSDLMLAGRELIRVTRPNGYLGVAVPLGGTFRCFTDMMKESAQRRGMGQVLKALKNYTGALLEESTLKDSFAKAGLEVIGYSVVPFTLEFKSAEEFLFSPFVDDTFLPRWLAICSDDQQREPLFYDVVQALNTFFSGISFTTEVKVACVLSRPLQR